MGSADKTREQILEELARLRVRVAELEAKEEQAKQVKNTLEETLIRQKAILDNIPDMAWLKDEKGRFILMNPAFAAASGIETEELIGKTDFDFWPPEFAQRFVDDDKFVMKSGERKIIEEPRVHNDGETVWIETIKSPIYGADGRVIGTTGISRDITERKLAAEKLRELAIMDSLTGLFNRRHFIELSEREFNRSSRYGKDLSMMMMDIDHFKAVNDTHGHHVGDEVLSALAEIFRSGLRSTDVVGRLGGEEFGVLLPETGLPEALPLAERVRRTVADKPIPTSAGNLAVTISIGVATVTTEAYRLESLMQRADEALYKAKDNGRNRVEKP
jgi:diguanylate cyclase (GGDEF)-like protein/PAS domain S-box-containing protein